MALAGREHKTDRLISLILFPAKAIVRRRFLRLTMDLVSGGRRFPCPPHTITISKATTVTDPIPLHYFGQ